MRIVVIFTFLVFLSSCGSGGGGGSATSAFANFSTATLTSSCGTSCSASDFSTAEYFTAVSFYDGGVQSSQDFLGIINADDAYAYLSNNSKNWAGDGIDVAVVDTGIVMSHSDLDGNYSSDSHSGSLQDVSGHGTHVAGIIAAEKNDSTMHGVAPNANLLSVALYGLGYTDGNGDPQNVSYGTSDYDGFVVSSGATVVNGSWTSGSASSALQAEIENMADNGDSRLVQVFAAGNDANSNPDYPARYAGDTDVTNGEMLAVVAYDSGTDDIASFSNRCGDAQSYCIMAPGKYIYSTYNNGSYAVSSGTSMAAPVVSGAVAVIQSAWPSLTGSEIVTLLIDTAADYGTSGTDSTYGVGLLDLDAAVTSQGSKGAGIGFGGEMFSYDDGELFISAEYAEFFEVSAFQEFISKGVFFDKYNRDFKADYLSQVIFYNTDKTSSSFTNIISESDYKTANASFRQKGLHFNISNVTDNKSKYFFLEPGQEETDSSFDDLYYNFAAGNLSFNLSAGNVEHSDFIKDDLFYGSSSLTSNNFNNYFDQSAVVEGLNFSTSLKGDKQNLKFSMLSRSNTESDKAYHGFASEYSKDVANLSWSLAHKFYFEEESSLGLSGNEAFQLGGSSKSNALEFSSIARAGKYSYFFKYGFMETINSKKQAGFVKLDEKFYSTNLALGMVNELANNSEYGVVLSKPWQISSGSMQITIPTGLDLDGNIVTDSYHMDLSAKQSYDYELFWQKQLSELANLKLNLVTHHTKLYEQEDFNSELYLRYSLNF